MAKTADELAGLIRGDFLRDARKEWARLRWLQKNIDGGLNKTWMPENADLEYRDLFRKARSPWLRFVRDCIAQGLIVDGYTHNDIWLDAWQENGMDGRQGQVTREAIGLGYSFVLSLPAVGGGVVMRPLSATRTFMSKADPWDEFPDLVLHRVADKKWMAIDSEAVYRFEGDPEHIGEMGVTRHDLGFVPVAMVPNSYATDGYPESEIEPAIPVYKRIVDATFTLQMVQRYGAFPQKNMAGGSIATDADGNALIRPAVDSLLHSTDPLTKFGSFPAADLDKVSSSVDTHIKHLSAVCQVPPHYLLGSVVNMSAEGIAAAESGYFRNIDDHKVVMGEGYELALRSAAAILGRDAADDTAAEIHWRDTSTRSLAQTSDAVVKLATVGAPLEMLFALIPGWSKSDAIEAAEHVRSNGSQSLPEAIQANAQKAVDGFRGLELPVEGDQ